MLESDIRYRNRHLTLAILLSNAGCVPGLLNYRDLTNTGKPSGPATGRAAFGALNAAALTPTFLSAPRMPARLRYVRTIRQFAFRPKPLMATGSLQRFQSWRRRFRVPS